MEEPIDPVALGLKRGPRGAVALVLLVAIPLGIVAVRSVESAPTSTPLAAPEQPPVVVAPASPAPSRSRLKRTAQPQKRITAPVVLRAPVRESAGVREVSPSATTGADTVTSESQGTSIASAGAEVSASPTETRAEAMMNDPTRQSDAAVLEAESVSPSSPARLVEEDDVAPPAPQPEPEDGNGEAIARAIAAEKRAAVRACFESELKQSPKLHGTVVVELDLAPPNRVNGVRVSDDLQRAAFTSCVAATMRDVRFAALDEEISVSVPYVLTPATK